MQIFVKINRFQPIQCGFEASDTISTIKDMAAYVINIDKDLLGVVRFAGKQLKAGSMLSDYNIQSGDLLKIQMTREGLAYVRALWH
jgi:hypothetical protein